MTIQVNDQPSPSDKSQSPSSNVAGVPPGLGGRGLQPKGKEVSTN